MICCPVDYLLSLGFRQVTRIIIQRFDDYQLFILYILCMKMRRWMITRVNVDLYTVNNFNCLQIMLSIWITNIMFALLTFK